MTDNIILTIGSDIEEVDPFAYSENRDIKEIYVPENVKKIGAHAFYNCRSMYRLTLENASVDIGDGAFKNCERLKEISIYYKSGGNLKSLKSILADIHTEVKVHIFYDDGEASLIFPYGIDNYEENMQMLESEEKAQYVAEIDKVIYEWTNETNGILIKSDRDRYIYIFEQRYLEKIKEDKFSILDKIKELDPKQKVQFTLSIAISNEGEVDKDKYKSAQTAMDIVLGRGGDQAVVRQNDIYKFFGGRAQEVEKRTKVKARVVAHALENLIKESSKVMIMGHTNPDIDAMGSAIGIYRLAKSLDKNAYIISNNRPALQSFMDSLKEEPEYEDVIISKEVAEENIDEDTLLVVVDTHKVTYVESEEVLKKANKIVIIDHHRRSADYIENATLTFQEVYASSAAELVTELLQYAEVNVELKKIEAEALYAGIMMDTKSFTFKTGVRTFEAAAYLRKCGVDIIRVKKWFQSDLESFNKIADIVKKAEIVNDSIAIALCEDTKSKDISLLCAKAADELLTISDVTASFVLGDTGEKICISGRSIGDINVQVILEKLGGGGHITLAGAQVEGMTIEEVKQELIIRINEYFTEIEN